MPPFSRAYDWMSGSMVKKGSLYLPTSSSEKVDATCGGFNYVPAMETLGSRIRQARDAARLKQHQVAARFGIKRPTVAQWEAGTARPASDKIAPLAEMLGVSVDWLLNGSGSG